MVSEKLFTDTWIHYVCINRYSQMVGSTIYEESTCLIQLMMNLPNFKTN